MPPPPPPPPPRLTIAVVSFAAPAACNEVRGPVPCRPWPLAASELGDSGLERWAGGGVTASKEMAKWLANHNFPVAKSVLVLYGHRSTPAQLG